MQRLHFDLAFMQRRSVLTKLFDKASDCGCAATSVVTENFRGGVHVEPLVSLKLWRIASSASPIMENQCQRILLNSDRTKSAYLNGPTVRMKW